VPLTPVLESEGAPPPPTLAPVEEPYAVIALELKTLQRYNQTARPSLLGRLGRKLGLVQRIETA